MNADLFEPQHLAPDLGQGGLEGSAGGHIGPLEIGALRTRSRQCRAAHLAVRRERQRAEGQERGGDHVIRQPVVQEPAELVNRDSDPVRRHQVGHQAAVAGIILASHYHALADAGMALEGRLDLRRLDAVAPDLDLRVEASEEVKVPV